jgi:hypothetical protein
LCPGGVVCDRHGVEVVHPGAAEGAPGKARTKGPRGRPWRGRGDGQVFVCEGAGPTTITLPQEWTDRGGPGAPRALTYERLADLVKRLNAIMGS